MSAAYFLDKGLWIAWSFVGVAWVVGLGIAGLRQFKSLEKSTAFRGSNTVLNLLVIGATILVNLYIVLIIRRAAGYMTQRSYREANTLALLLFANCILWNSFYIASSLFYFFILVTTGDTKVTCDKTTPLVVWMMACNDEAHIYLGMILLAESVGNNLILIRQRYAREEVSYIWGCVKDAAVQWFSSPSSHSQERQLLLN